MINKILYSTIVLILLFSFTACSSDSPTDSNVTVDTNNTVLSGVAVDGYISRGTVCLDLNVNGVCDTNEPTTDTQNDGTFSFVGTDIAEGLFLPVILIGGTDTATNKSFVGEMKNILNSDTLESSLVLYITPLTDLVASLFMDSEIKSLATLAEAKRDIAFALGLSTITLTLDPMQNKELFAKTQEIRQIKELILASALKASESESNASIKNLLLKNISLATGRSLKNTDELNTTSILLELKTIYPDTDIPKNEVDFIFAQGVEIKTSLQKIVTNTSVSISDLENKQILLESKIEEAIQSIENAIEGETIEVIPIDITENATPIADANNNQNIQTATLVRLNGSLSSDTDGDVLTYLWEITSKPSLSNLILSNLTIVNPTFTPDVDGDYTFTLVVNDGTLDSVGDSVTIYARSENPDTISNNAPVADANRDQNIKTTALVILTGVLSSDVDHDILTYTWGITSKPNSSNATLSDSTTINPSFTADLEGSYIFSLVVNDGRVNSTADSVIVNATIGNAKPIADANRDQNVKTTSLVKLDASLSFDADSDILSYVWEITSKPSLSNVNLLDSTIINPEFIADVDGSYVFTLVVNDATEDSIADTIIINATTGNATPIADANKDQFIKTNTEVTLDGSLSSDADTNALTYRWRIISKPSLSTVSLSEPTIAKPTFIADRDGNYIFSLVVNDSTIDSTVDNVVINATSDNVAPVADANKDQYINIAKLITLNGSLSSDVDNDILNYTWSILSKPKLSNVVLVDSTIVNPTFIADIEGTYVFTLVVNDGTLSSKRDMVFIVAQAIRVSHNSIGYGIITSPFTQRIWLDRNLGASQVCTALDDTACYGDYFQWGREADGHEKNSNETNSSFTTNTIAPSDWSQEDLSGVLRATQWSKIDGSSICPIDYRVPTFSEISAETISATTAILNNTDAYNNFLKLPSSGYRSFSDASLNNDARYGYLWSSSVRNNIYSDSLFFNINSAGTGTDNSGYRAYGYPVRCIKN